MTSHFPNLTSPKSADIRSAFDRLQSAFSNEQAPSVRERRRMLKRLSDSIIRNKQEITEALAKDLKKPKTEALFTEVFPSAKECKHARRNLKRWVSPQPVGAPITLLGTRSRIDYQPKGVVLIISPWNFPFMLCILPLVSAVAAGNKVILKPSEYSVHTSIILKKICSECFNKSQVEIIQGGTPVAQDLLKLPFNHILFTGSPEVGKVVMKAAAEHLTSVTLELGGKSPSILAEDANIKEAANRIVWGKFMNGGQVCIAPDYILVPESLKDKFIEALSRSILRQIGTDGEVFGHSMSSMAHQGHYEKICFLVKEAEEGGSEMISFGNPDAPSRFYPPTLIINPAGNSGLMTSEIFGPLLPIVTYEGEKEMVDRVKSLPPPLTYHLFSRSRKWLRKMNSQLPAGSASINECVYPFVNPNLPFGGLNNSGIGKSHGYYGFLECINQKAVVTQITRFNTFHIGAPPYNKFKSWIANLVIRYF